MKAGSTMEQRDPCASKKQLLNKLANSGLIAAVIAYLGLAYYTLIVVG
jgi:hypothetical protein